MYVPKKVSDRITKTLLKFQQVIRIAKDRDVNESDTVSIIKDVLSEMLGYDKYLEITSEFAIRGTFCDVAIKVDEKIEFLLEAKAIGLELKDYHLRQALDYGANHGIQWVVLSNGEMWNIYKIRFEKPIGYDFVCSINLLELDPKNEQDKEKIFILCKEGLVKDAREEYFEKKQSVNRFILSELLLSDDVLSLVRRLLKKMSDGISVNNSDIQKILKNEVIKRDTLEGEEASRAKSRLKKLYKKSNNKSANTVKNIHKLENNIENQMSEQSSVADQ